MASSAPIETRRTYCKVCMVHCGLLVDVAGDRVVKVRGDREHPISKGYTCPKGRATGQIHHDPDAITQPLMRKEGALVAVTWDEALDDIAAKLRSLIDRHGGHAVGINFGSGLGLDSSGYTMEEALHAELGHGPKFTPLTIDGVAKVLVAGAVGRFPGLNAKTDYDGVELLLYIGTNPMVSHAHNTGMANPAPLIRAVAERGEVWTIDPVFTETAKFSTRHIAAWPGKDYAVLAWLVREVIAAGPLNPVQPIDGLDELAALLSDYTLEKAAAIAGVAEQDLTDLLSAVRRHGRLSVETGTGVTMSAGCNLTQWLAWVLMILTGSMNRPGGAWFHSGMLTPFDAFDLPDMDAWTPGSKTRPDVDGVLGDWPCAVLPDEIAAGNIRGLFNFGGRLLRNFPDTDRLAAALDTLEFNVMTEISANETSAAASHVLPTKGPLERVEFTRWDTLNWNANLQLSEALLPVSGERRSAWWVISQIMRRADLPVANDIPVGHDEPGADEAMLARLFSPISRCSFDELKEQRFIQRDMEFPAPWVDRHIERVGGWKLMPDRIVAQWREMRALDEAEIGQPRPLVFTSRRQRRKLNAQLDFLGAEANALVSPADAEAHGISEGQPLRIRTTSGEAEFTARIDPGMRRGVISIAHGHLPANVNRLTSTRTIDPISGMALYTGVPIEIG